MAAKSKIDVKWDFTHQTWVATNSDYPGLAGVSPNKTRARFYLRQATNEQDERRASEQRGRSHSYAGF